MEILKLKSKITKMKNSLHNSQALYTMGKQIQTAYHSWPSKIDTLTEIYNAI